MFYEIDVEIIRVVLQMTIALNRMNSESPKPPTKEIRKLL